METAVKTLKDEVIEYLTQSENARLFEAVKQEIHHFETRDLSVKEWMEQLMAGDRDLREGRTYTTEQVKAELEAWKTARRKSA